MIPPVSNEVVSPARFTEVGSLSPKAGDSQDFSSFLKGLVQEADQGIKAADESTVQFLQGKTGIHELSMSLERADLNLRLMTRVRNRIIEAYQEISRMNV